MCVDEQCREKAIKRKEEQEKSRKEKILSERHSNGSTPSSQTNGSDGIVLQNISSNNGFCKSCGAQYLDDQNFCYKCGAPKEQFNKLYCKGCGTELQQGLSFCPKCGTKTTSDLDLPNAAIADYNNNVQKKKKSKGPIIAIISAVALILIIAIIGSGVSESQKAQAVEDWMSKADLFYSSCLSCGSDLESVGTEIGDYWKEYIYSGSRYGTSYHGHYLYSVDSAVAAALADNSSTVSSIKSAYSSISSSYNSLSELPEDDTGSVSLIWSRINDVYDDLDDMYDCVINVSGNYSSFVSTYNSCDSSLADSLSDLKSALN